MKIGKRKLLIMIFIFIATIFICTSRSNATLNLNALNFDVQVNYDGSMNVTETWNIYISNTNTLFKTFEKDSSKYSNITNVTVKDLSTSTRLTEIDEEMYHVTKNCYYALDNSSGDFEIAWGVGLDNSSATKVYQISYKVEDAIAKYNDYAELYWQFIGEDFEIDADIIKGTITLPENADSTDDILVWGHTEDLNGEIYATSVDTIEFEVYNYSSGNYVEVRTLIPTEMIFSSGRTYSYDILDSVVEEENEWAKEANAKRQREKFIRYAITVIAFLIFAYFVIKIFINLIKLIKIGKKVKPSIKLKYYRDLPYENATPSEALFVTSNGKICEFSQSFSANILDLCLKGYVSLSVEKDGRLFKKDMVKITILDGATEKLKPDQKLTLKFLKEVDSLDYKFKKNATVNKNLDIDVAETHEITTKDITKYLELYPSKIGTLNSEMRKIVKDTAVSREIYDKENETESKRYSSKASNYFAWASICIVSMIGLPFAIPLLINGIITLIISRRINKFTGKGVNEKEQWKALKKYMEDFSLLNEKEVPDLVLWEKFLVFATAFGISDRVLKQLKVAYPEMMNIDANLNTYNYIAVMSSINIGNCINDAVRTATIHTERSNFSSGFSSGGGGGGGFSGGGGGGRRPVVADGGR